MKSPTMLRGAFCLRPFDSSLVYSSLVPVLFHVQFRPDRSFKNGLGTSASPSGGGGGSKPAGDKDRDRDSRD